MNRRELNTALYKLNISINLNQESTLKGIIISFLYAKVLWWAIAIKLVNHLYMAYRVFAEKKRVSF